MTDPTTAVALLRDAEAYLSALHTHVARHDQIGADLTCGGCLLRDRIAAALPVLAAVPPANRTTDRAGLRDRIAALFRHPPGVERLGNATPGEIADTVLAALPAPVDQGARFGSVRPQTLTAIASHLDARAVAILRPESEVYAEWQTVIDGLRRLAAEAPQTETPDEAAVVAQPGKENDAEARRDGAQS